MSLRTRHAAAVLAAAAAAGVQAQTPSVPANVLSLNASATVEVTKDVLAVTFTASREGADATAVQNQLKQALDAALAEAKKIAKPGQVEVQTGNFSLYPRYTSKGGINGWQGSAELVVEGKDVAAIAQLTGRVQTMTIARVMFSLSREARAKVESDVTAQAIARFREKAEFAARQFGFGGYTLREVTVSANDAGSPIPGPMLRTQAMASEAALPVEAGKANVTATVAGGVQMQK